MERSKYKPRLMSQTYCDKLTAWLPQLLNGDGFEIKANKDPDYSYVTKIKFSDIICNTKILFICELASERSRLVLLLNRHNSFQTGESFQHTIKVGNLLQKSSLHGNWGQLTFDFTVSIAKWNFLLMLLFTMVGNCRSQVTDEQLFKKTYWKEQDELSKDRQYKKPNGEQYSIGVSDLPDWFWNIPQSDHETRYAIGISDPLMHDTLTARQLAIDRALMQFGMMESTKFTGVSDLYDKNLQNKYEELCQIQSEATIRGSYTIADSFNTRFGEKIYLLKFWNRSSDTLSIRNLIQKYKSYSKIEMGWYSIGKTEYTVRIGARKYYYGLVEDNNKTEIVSVSNGDSIQAYNYMYEYTLAPEKADKNLYSILKLYGRGLWWGYFQAFTNCLQWTISNKTSKIKRMDEIKSDGNGTILNNALSRSIEKDCVCFSISGIKTKHGHIEMDFNIHSNKQ